jgi:phospholipid/cholesterol/gamma-HCH transport system permease protein
MNWMWPPPLPFENEDLLEKVLPHEEGASNTSSRQNQNSDHAQAAGGQSVLFSFGKRSLALFHDIGGLFFMALDFALMSLSLSVDRRETLRHFHRFCFGSLPVIFGGSLIVGGVVAMQGLGYLSRYNATEVFGWAAGLSAYREVGPLLLGMTIAARLGAKNTAELITMRSRERLDSLTALGLNVEQTVYAPRFWGIVLSTFVLFPICAFVILMTSFVLAYWIGDQNVFVSWYSFTTYIRPSQILQGFLRMTLFGAWVGLCSCYFSCHRPDRDARAIGQSVFASSVASMTGVVTINLYLSFLAGAN